MSVSWLNSCAVTPSALAGKKNVLTQVTGEMNLVIVYTECGCYCGNPEVNRTEGHFDKRQWLIIFTGEYLQMLFYVQGTL